MSSLAWKRLLGKFVIKNKPEFRKIILLYHSVGNGPLAMSSEVFQEQMRFLKDHCEVMSLTQLLHEKPNKTLQVAITFDDGYACLYNIVAPILHELQISPMVYLNTGWISEVDLNRYASDEQLGHYPSEKFLTWEEVQNLHKKGWEFGSHGVNHLDFTSLKTVHAMEELTLSKKHIEDHLGIKCKHFAYTWGKYSKNLMKVVQNTDYHYAVSGIHGHITNKSNFLALPRLNIPNEYSLDDFKKLVFGQYDFLGIIQKVRRLLME